MGYIRFQLRLLLSPWNQISSIVLKSTKPDIKMIKSQLKPLSHCRWTQKYKIRRSQWDLGPAWCTTITMITIQTPELRWKHIQLRCCMKAKFPCLYPSTRQSVRVSMKLWVCIVEWRTRKKRCEPPGGCTCLHVLRHYGQVQSNNYSRPCISPYIVRLRFHIEWEIVVKVEMALIPAPTKA